jgi:carbon storage regulator
MLILSRKKDERIQIGDNITVTVVEIRGDKVRLGIEAPLSIPIERDDIKYRTPKDRTPLTLGILAEANKAEEFRLPVDSERLDAFEDYGDDDPDESEDDEDFWGDDDENEWYSDDDLDGRQFHQLPDAQGASHV